MAHLQSAVEQPEGGHGNAGDPPNGARPACPDQALSATRQVHEGTVLFEVEQTLVLDLHVEARKIERRCRAASAALLAAVIVGCAKAPPDVPVSPSDRVRALAPVERVEVSVAESFSPNTSSASSRARRIAVSGSTHSTCGSTAAPCTSRSGTSSSAPPFVPSAPPGTSAGDREKQSGWWRCREVVGSHS